MIKYTSKDIHKRIKEAKEIGCNLEFSPKVLENILKSQRQEIKKDLLKKITKQVK